MTDLEATDQFADVYTVEHTALYCQMTDKWTDWLLRQRQRATWIKDAVIVAEDEEHHVFSSWSVCLLASYFWASVRQSCGMSAAARCTVRWLIAADTSHRQTDSRMNMNGSAQHSASLLHTAHVVIHVDARQTDTASLCSVSLLTSTLLQCYACSDRITNFHLHWS